MGITCIEEREAERKWVLFLVPQMAKECQQLIEIVANFPKELVVARYYARVPDLIGGVKCQF